MAGHKKELMAVRRCHRLFRIGLGGNDQTFERRVVVQSAIRLWLVRSVSHALFVLETLDHAARARAAWTAQIRHRAPIFLCADLVARSLSFRSKP